MQESQQIFHENKSESLQSIFLYQSEDSNSKTGVMRGLHFASINLVRRVGNLRKEDVVDHFFDEQQRPLDIFFELMGFWEIIKNRIRVLNQREKKQFPILSIIHEIDGSYHWFKYYNLAEKLGVAFEDKVEKLCSNIEEIFNNKVIKILDFDMKVKFEISLQEFEKFIGGFEYMFVKYHLAKTMIDGGIAVVVAGSEGLTPRRLHGYVLRDKEWERCPPNILEAHREMLLQPEKEARERGMLRGCRYV